MKSSIAEFLENATAFGCVGSRDDLDDLRIKTCTLIGMYLAKAGKTVHSGNAIGTDQVYAIGANAVDPASVYLYLTGTDHNPEAVVLGNKLVYESDHPEWASVAEKYHGGYRKLSPFVQKLFNRNAGIVTNSQVLIAMANRSKKWGGGTGHDIRIANGLGIPVIDLNDDEQSRDIITHILSSGLIV